MIVSLRVCCILLVIAAACRPAPPGPAPTPDTPSDDRPVYGITVEDAAEVGLLRERLRVEPVAIEGTTLYFVDSAGRLDALRAAGYTPVRADAQQVRRRVIRIDRRGSEAELARTGVRIINREDRYWIASATLGQVEVLRRLGYIVGEAPEGEPDPREVRIVVPRRADIARIAELHVDVYSARDTAGAVEVRAGAFDEQIDRLRALGFTVERIGPTPP